MTKLHTAPGVYLAGRENLSTLSASPPSTIPAVKLLSQFYPSLKDSIEMKQAYRDAMLQRRYKHAETKDDPVQSTPWRLLRTSLGGLRALLSFLSELSFPSAPAVRKTILVLEIRGAKSWVDIHIRGTHFQYERYRYAWVV